MRWKERRIDFQSDRTLSEGRIVLAAVVEGQPDPCIDGHGKRVQIQSLLQLRSGLGEAAERHQALREGLPSPGVIGIHVQYHARLSEGTLRIPIVAEPHQHERGAGLDLCGLDLEGLFGRSLCLRHGVFGCQIAVDAEGEIGFRETGVRQSVARIPFERLLEIGDSPVQPLLGPFVRRKATLEIQRVNVGVDRVGRRCRASLRRKQAYLQRLGSMQGDVGLDGQDVLQFPVVLLGPEVLVGLRVDQLDADSNLVSGFANTSFDDRADAQFSGDLRDSLLSVLVAHCGGTGDHLKPADGRKRRDQFLG